MASLTLFEALISIGMAVLLIILAAVEISIFRTHRKLDAQCDEALGYESARPWEIKP